MMDYDTTSSYQMQAWVRLCVVLLIRHATKQQKTTGGGGGPADVRSRKIFRSWKHQISKQNIQK